MSCTFPILPVGSIEIHRNPSRTVFWFLTTSLVGLWWACDSLYWFLLEFQGAYFDVQLIHEAFIHRLPVQLLHFRLAGQKDVKLWAGRTLAAAQKARLPHHTKRFFPRWGATVSAGRGQEVSPPSLQVQRRIVRVTSHSSRTDTGPDSLGEVNKSWTLIAVMWLLFLALVSPWEVKGRTGEHSGGLDGCGWRWRFILHNTQAMEAGDPLQLDVLTCNEEGWFTEAAQKKHN